MRIVYEGNLLSRILRLNELHKISHVHVSQKDYDDVLEAAKECGQYERQGDYWIALKCDVVVYLDKDEEDDESC